MKEKSQKQKMESKSKQQKATKTDYSSCLSGLSKHFKETRNINMSEKMIEKALEFAVSLHIALSCFKVG
jgi:hypothetical protein